MDSLSHFHSQNVYVFIHYSYSLKVIYVSKKFGLTLPLNSEVLLWHKLAESDRKTKKKFVCVFVYHVYCFLSEMICK